MSELRERIAKVVRDIRLDAKGTHGALGVTASDEGWTDRILALLEDEPAEAEGEPVERPCTFGEAADFVSDVRKWLDGQRGERKEGALLPCPFCGSDKVGVTPPTCRPETPYNPADRLYPLASCRTCQASVPGENEDYRARSAVEAWNLRTQDHPAEAEGEEQEEQGYEDTVREVALAMMQYRSGPGQPDEDLARVAIGTFLRHVDRKALVNSFRTQEAEPVEELFLCEANAVVLQADTLYRFVEDPDCAKCKEEADVYRDPVGQPQRGESDGSA